MTTNETFNPNFDQDFTEEVAKVTELSFNDLLRAQGCPEEVITGVYTKGPNFAINSLIADPNSLDAPLLNDLDPLF